jgi:hypothetical protein
MRNTPTWLNHALMILSVVIFLMMSSKTADQLWPAHSIKIDAVLSLLSTLLGAFGYRGALLTTPPAKPDAGGDGK